MSPRKGRGKPYTATTIRDYERSYVNFLRPEFGPFAADDIGEVEWQMWVDRLSREGLSRSRITTHVAVASAIYAWAIVPSRRLATRNPLRLVELPPNDEKPRLRVAFAPEAGRLLGALEPKDAVPYAIAFYAGLRRAEIARLEWRDVLDGKRVGPRLLVTRAKSEAGRERRPPPRPRRPRDQFPGGPPTRRMTFEPLRPVTYRGELVALAGRRRFHLLAPWLDDRPARPRDGGNA